MGKRTEHKVRDSLTFGGILLAGAVVVIAVGPQDHVGQEALVLVAGVGAATVWMRFGPPIWWLSSIILASALVMWLLLGPLGIVWMAGFGAGMNLGVAWRDNSTKNRKPGKKWGWTVDGRGYDTQQEARGAAGKALRALDGKVRGRFEVQHGASAFQVAGSMKGGLVCHRNADASDERTWAVLGRGREAAGVMDVPMGRRVTGSIPVALVNDYAAVESALDDFFQNPAVEPAGPVWVTGDMAEGSRLSAG